jgi:hypothetical protein
MPRQPRILLDAVPLHIVQRDHNRDPYFFADEDFHTYLRWLGEDLRENQRRESGSAHLIATLIRLTGLRRIPLARISVAALPTHRAAS